MNDGYDRHPPPPYYAGGYPQQPPGYGQYPSGGYGSPPQQQGYYQYSYPPGPPKDDGMSAGLIVLVIVVILIVILIPIIIGALMMGIWTSSLADTGEGVTLLNLSGMIEVDSYSGTTNVSLSHNGGDPIDWYEFQVTVGGAAASGNPVNPVTGSMVTRTSVGETAMWTLPNYVGPYAIGDQYTIKVITIQDSTIVWQKDITATYA